LKRATKDLEKEIIIEEKVKESSTSDEETGWDYENEDDKGREIFEAYIECMSQDEMK
jgi:hypothetical protein